LKLEKEQAMHFMAQSLQQGFGNDPESRKVAHASLAKLSMTARAQKNNTGGCVNYDQGNINAHNRPHTAPVNLKK